MTAWNDSSLRWRSRFLAGSSSGRQGVAPRSTRTLIAVLCVAPVIAYANGCSRTVLVPEASPIRIGPDARTRVYVLDAGQWVLSSQKVAIPEGWYCVPPSYVEKP